jgi:hypothetical protein
MRLDFGGITLATMQFGRWIFVTSQSSAEIATLQTFAAANFLIWPRDAVQKEEYATAIDRSDVASDAEKEAARHALEVAWQMFAEDEDRSDTRRLQDALAAVTAQVAALADAQVASATEIQKLATAPAPPPKQAGFLGWLSSGIGAWGTALIAFIILLGIWLRLDDPFLKELTNLETTRGLIGFLFAVGTIGIAILSVVAVYASTDVGITLADRFSHSKDILTILIGVFGTVIGFYFGQAVTDTAGNGNLPEVIGTADNATPPPEANEPPSGATTPGSPTESAQ